MKNGEVKSAYNWININRQHEIFSNSNKSDNILTSYLKNTVPSEKVFNIDKITPKNFIEKLNSGFPSEIDTCIKYIVLKNIALNCGLLHKDLKVCNLFSKRTCTDVRSPFGSRNELYSYFDDLVSSIKTALINDAVFYVLASKVTNIGKPSRDDLPFEIFIDGKSDDDFDENSDEESETYLKIKKYKLLTKEQLSNFLCELSRTLWPSKIETSLVFSDQMRNLSRICIPTLVFLGINKNLSTKKKATLSPRSNVFKYLKAAYDSSFYIKSGDPAVKENQNLALLRERFLLYEYHQPSTRILDIRDNGTSKYEAIKKISCVKISINSSLDDEKSPTPELVEEQFSSITKGIISRLQDEGPITEKLPGLVVFNRILQDCEVVSANGELNSNHSLNMLLFDELTGFISLLDSLISHTEQNIPLSGLKNTLYMKNMAYGVDISITTSQAELLGKSKRFIAACLKKSKFLSNMSLSDIDPIKNYITEVLKQNVPPIPDYNVPIIDYHDH